MIMLDHLDALFRKKTGSVPDWHQLTKNYPSSALLYLMYIRHKHFSNPNHKPSLLADAEKNEDLARLYLFFYDSPLWVEYLLKRPKLEYIWHKKDARITDFARANTVKLAAKASDSAKSEPSLDEPQDLAAAETIAASATAKAPRAKAPTMPKPEPASAKSETSSKSVSKKGKSTKPTKPKTAASDMPSELEDLTLMPKIKRSIKQLDKELVSRALGKSDKEQEAQLGKPKLDKKPVSKTANLNAKSRAKTATSKIATSKTVANKIIAPTNTSANSKALAPKSGELHSFEAWLSRKEIKPVAGSFGVFASQEVEVYTETMAKVYEKQGDLARALAIYERLADQDSAKNFTSKINTLKGKIAEQG